MRIVRPSELVRRVSHLRERELTGHGRPMRGGVDSSGGSELHHARSRLEWLPRSCLKTAFSGMGMRSFLRRAFNAQASRSTAIFRANARSPGLRALARGSPRSRGAKGGRIDPCLAEAAARRVSSSTREVGGLLERRRGQPLTRSWLAQHFAGSRTCGATRTSYGPPRPSQPMAPRGKGVLHRGARRGGSSSLQEASRVLRRRAARSPGARRPRAALAPPRKVRRISRYQCIRCCVLATLRSIEPAACRTSIAPHVEIMLLPEPEGIVHLERAGSRHNPFKVTDFRHPVFSRTGYSMPRAPAGP
jgi:hypothetical protein